MKRVIPVISGIDEAYVMPYAVMMHSLIVNLGSGWHVEAYCIAKNVSEKSKSKIKKVLCNHGNKVSIDFVDVKNERLKELRSSDHLSEATYLRLLGPKIIGKKHKKVIYLDSDIIVKKDISSIYKKEIGSNVLMATKSYRPSTIGESEIDSSLSSVDSQDTYFNSGVLVINVKEWRKKSLGESVIKFCSNNPEMTPFADQDGLNAVLGGNWKEINPLWNVQVHAIDEYLNEGVISKSLEEICLIHYTSGKKPWNSWGRRKYEKEFQVYLKESGWFSNIEWLIWILETRLRILANEIEKRWKKISML